MLQHPGAKDNNDTTRPYFFCVGIEDQFAGEPFTISVIILEGSKQCSVNNVYPGLASWNRWKSKSDFVYRRRCGRWARSQYAGIAPEDLYRAWVYQGWTLWCHYPDFAFHFPTESFTLHDLRGWKIWPLQQVQSFQGYEFSDLVNPLPNASTDLAFPYDDTPAQTWRRRWNVCNEISILVGHSRIEKIW